MISDFREGVGFQKSESPCKKAFSMRGKSEIGGGGSKMTHKNRISFMDGPIKFLYQIGVV